MKILFWGTPYFAVPSLRALDEEGHDVVGVVTQPDRPAGRGRQLRPSPVKEVAEASGIPVLQPDAPHGEAFLDEVRSLGPELSIVVAYGKILRPEVLEMPSQGSLNVHASLLPELRGAAPINWALARGHEKTGVTIMRMTAGLDEGPMLFAAEEPIASDETASDLTVRLSEVGAEALLEALALLGAGVIEEVEQDHDVATYAPKIDRATARVDWARTAIEIDRHIRAMDAVPGAWSELEGVPIKVFRPEAAPPPGGMSTTVPGAVIEVDEAEGILVGCGEGGAVWVREVQPSGRKRIGAGDWVRGRGVSVGQTLV